MLYDLLVDIISFPTPVVHLVAKSHFFDGVARLCYEITCYLRNLRMRIEFSFQVNSQLISNVCTDALSAEKVMDI
jgi:hypothetical protein